jgi:aminoglycoside/choline kinase family phosphotransferase
MSSERLLTLTHWVIQKLESNDISLHLLTGDASFRQYFRVNFLGDQSATAAPHRSLIVMDAPPPHEDCRPFLAVSEMLERHGVRVPHVIASDVTLGFILLEDFGDTVLSQVLTAENVDAIYAQAMNQLIELQQTPPLELYPLPAYGEMKLVEEMSLFDEWFLRKFLMLKPSPQEQALLVSTYDFLANQALHQPQVVVHRDYHCRNLMVLDQTQELGIIDFQDAVIGPVTYDIVSLLRDAYVQWPAEKVQEWLKIYWERQSVNGQLGSTSLVELQQWFDWMGAQRHLKVLGIFARLNFRDGKDGYLNDLPLVLFYLLTETKGYNELSAFHLWLCERVLPAFLVEMPDSMPLLQEFL